MRKSFNKVNLAAEILPYKMSSNITSQRPKKLISIKPRGLLRDHTTLRHIITQIALSDSLFHFVFEVEEWNTQSTDINHRLDLNIIQIPYPPDTTWATTATNHLNIIKHLIRTEDVTSPLKKG